MKPELRNLLKETSETLNNLHAKQKAIDSKLENTRRKDLDAALAEQSNRLFIDIFNKIKETRAALKNNPEIENREDQRLVIQFYLNVAKYSSDSITHDYKFEGFRRNDQSCTVYAFAERIEKRTDDLLELSSESGEVLKPLQENRELQSLQRSLQEMYGKLSKYIEEKNKLRKMSEAPTNAMIAQGDFVGVSSVLQENELPQTIYPNDASSSTTSNSAASTAAPTKNSFDEMGEEKIHYPISGASLSHPAHTQPSKKYYLDYKNMVLSNPTVPHDFYKQYNHFTLEEKINLLTATSTGLVELFNYRKVIAETNLENFIQHANKINQHLRLISRLAAELPWESKEDKTKIFTLINSIFGVLDEHGWNCSADGVIGLAYAKGRKFSFEHIKPEERLQVEKKQKERLYEQFKNGVLGPDTGNGGAFSDPQKFATELAKICKKYAADKNKGLELDKSTGTSTKAANPLTNAGSNRTVPTTYPPSANSAATAQQEQRPFYILMKRILRVEPDNNLPSTISHHLNQNIDLLNERIREKLRQHRNDIDLTLITAQALHGKNLNAMKALLSFISDNNKSALNAAIKSSGTQHAYRGCNALAIAILTVNIPLVEMLLAKDATLAVSKLKLSPLQASLRDIELANPNLTSQLKNKFPILQDTSASASNAASPSRKRTAAAAALDTNDGYEDDALEAQNLSAQPAPRQLQTESTSSTAGMNSTTYSIPHTTSDAVRMQTQNHVPAPNYAPPVSQNFQFGSQTALPNMRQPQSGSQSTFSNMTQPQFSSQSTFSNMTQPQFGSQTTFSNMRQPQFGSHTTFSNMRQPQFGSQTTFSNMAQPQFGAPARHHYHYGPIHTYEYPTTPMGSNQSYGTMGHTHMGQTTMTAPPSQSLTAAPQRFFGGSSQLNPSGWMMQDFDRHAEHHNHRQNTAASSSLPFAASTSSPPRSPDFNSFFRPSSPIGRLDLDPLNPLEDFLDNSYFPIR